MPNILVLHGPNMGLQGVAAVDESLAARAEELGVELTLVQSNTEGVLLDALVERREELDGVIINPGVWAPAAWALAEALTLVSKPAVEVLLSPSTRGPSALTGAVALQVHDQGVKGYLTALEHLAKALPKPTVGAGDEPGPPVSVPGKTIGRRPTPEQEEQASLRSPKTIGRKPPPSTQPTSASRGPTVRSAAGSGLTRAQVRQKVSARLGGTLSTDALASWARSEWSLLQKGGPCEEGRRELLDSVLLTLMAASRASEHVLLAQLARLE